MSDPALTKAWWSLGSEARRECPATLAERAPDEWDAAVALGAWLVEEDRTADALVWTAALQSDPRGADDPEVLLLSAEAAGAAGEAQGCRSLASRVAALRDDPATVLRLSAALEEAGLPDDALEQVGAGLARSPDARALQERWGALGGGPDRLVHLDHGDWLYRLVSGDPDYDALVSSLVGVRIEAWHLRRMKAVFEDEQVRPMYRRAIHVAHLEIEDAVARQWERPETVERGPWERAWDLYRAGGQPSDVYRHARHTVHHAPRARWANKMWLEAMLRVGVDTEERKTVAMEVLLRCGRDPEVRACLHRELPPPERWSVLGVGAWEAMNRLAIPDAVVLAEEARSVATSLTPIAPGVYRTYFRVMTECGRSSRVVSLIDVLLPATRDDPTWQAVLRLEREALRTEATSESLLARLPSVEAFSTEPSIVQCLVEAAVRSSAPAELLDRAEDVAGSNPGLLSKVAAARAQCGQAPGENLAEAHELAIEWGGPVIPWTLSVLVRLARHRLAEGDPGAVLPALAEASAELRKFGDPSVPAAVELDLVGAEVAHAGGDPATARLLAGRAALRIDPEWDDVQRLSSAAKALSERLG